MKRSRPSTSVIAPLWAVLASCSGGGVEGSRAGTDTSAGSPSTAPSAVASGGAASAGMSSAGAAQSASGATSDAGGSDAGGTSQGTGGSSSSGMGGSGGGSAPGGAGNAAGVAGRQSAGASGMGQAQAGGAGAETGGDSAGGMPAGGAAQAGTGGMAQNQGTDPDALATVSGWFDNEDVIPSWATANMGGARDAIIDALIKSCEMFGPEPASNPGWIEEYCWAHLTSSMLKESSYQPTLNDTENSPGRDSYSVRTVAGGATAYDPTIGLLQVRFSSTVKDYTQYGPRDAVAYIGCDFPELGHENESGDSDFWAVTGPTQYMSLMTDVACNVALGSWYYYLYATGNGVEGQPIYAYDYCELDRGTPATLTVGLLSHLNGPSGAYRTDAGSNDYLTNIRATFTACMGGTLPSPDPFTISLQPNPGQYCR